MDWGRAKSILIVAFLALNLVLGYQLWNSRAEQSNVVEETRRMLETKNITLAADIPKETPPLKQITVRLHPEYRGTATVTIDPPIPYERLLSKRSLKDVLGKDTLARLNLYEPDLYRLDFAAGKDGALIFNQMYDNVPLFDINVVLYVENDEITGYKQVHVEVQSEGEDMNKNQPVISAYTAVRILADGYLPEGAEIIDVQLGYHGMQFDSDTRIMPPFWRITLADRSAFYVDAFSGAVDGSPPA